jgi:hypothetical protein
MFSHGNKQHRAIPQLDIKSESSASGSTSSIIGPKDFFVSSNIGTKKLLHPAIKLSI